VIVELDWREEHGGTFSPRPALTLRFRMTDEDDLTVNNFKTLAMAAAVLSSVVFAMPTSSRAMPQAAPVKIDAASNGNTVQVHYRRYCRNGRCYSRYHRNREHLRSDYPCPPYYGYYLPRYGADRPCKSYYRPHYGYHRRPGVGLYFSFLD
jgi:hypothetical protein